jgi:hypothetical protein
MWLFTKQGFISIVQHRDDPDLMRVRARVRADLERCFPRREAEIIEDRVADYRWHLNVPRAEVAEYLMFAIEDLDYVSHVKEEIALGLAPAARMDAMYDIWSAMWRVQQSMLPPPSPEPFQPYLWGAQSRHPAGTKINKRKKGRKR